MEKMILITGPCVIENEELVFSIAEALWEFNENDRIDFYFKSSFDKANRTGINSFRGPGLERGLEILQEVREKSKVQILTDIHEGHQVKRTGEVADVLQIPAFLCRQTDLLVAAAKTPAKINIKKRQFLTPSDIQYSIKKVLQTRGIKEQGYEIAEKNGVFMAERGSSFGCGNLVVDVRSLVIMKEFAPVIFDATHSVQMSGAAGGSSGGKSEFVEPLAGAAAVIGVDDFFFEAYINPCEVLCDGANMLNIKRLKGYVSTLLKIQEII